MSAKSGPESLLFLRHPDGEWIVGWGNFERRSGPAPARPAFFLPDFFGQEAAPWWIPEHCEVLGQRELLALFPGLQGGSVDPMRRQWDGPDRATFAAEFEDLVQKIRDGQLRKAVPVALQSTEGIPDRNEFYRLWRRTLTVPSRWLAYGGNWGREGLIGLSPEILFFSQPGWTEVMALAGTAAENGLDLLQCKKNRHEHELVVEDIRRQLGRFGEVKSTPTREWKVGFLKHLRTDLALERDIPFTDLVEALHPTPALGVAPRAVGLEVLRGLSSAQLRRRFGAPFGVNIPGEVALACVAIRGLQWHEGQTWIASGCGVVSGSDFETEWNELELKRGVVKEQFGV